MPDPSPFEFDITLHGKPAHVQVKLLPWSQVALFAINPEAVQPTRLLTSYKSNLQYPIERIDGKIFTRALREALISDPAACAAVFAHRFDFYQRVRGAGRMYAQCPHCKDGEVEMSLLALFDTVGVMPPEMFSPDTIYFRPPVTSDTPGIPRRPKHFAYASRFRFMLPTKLLDLPRASFASGVLDRGKFRRMESMLERWETDGVNVPAEKGWHTRRYQSFRSTLWLMSALHELEPAGELTLETMEQLPAVDFYFLDAIYHLTFEVDVPEGGMERTCPRCTRTFMPVAPWVFEA